ncbi:RDD family protein [Streptomyces sp. NBC_01190]|uniref:RDD family protein n=1 Tax=Streptomyces sp. NBC_01190 TaxID=2903767 RepID=UPI00386A9BCB|nr:RDD family protein [Streptomyces sp. NBC_01190]
MPPQDAYGQPPAGIPPLANWGWRVLSSLIDGLFAGVPNLIFGLAIGGGAGRAISDLWSLIVLLALCWMEGTTGQTPGKKVVGTRTLRAADGNLLGFGLALGRKVLHIVDALPCLLGFLWPAWDSKRQTFADKIVSSVVIRP